MTKDDADRTIEAIRLVLDSLFLTIKEDQANLQEAIDALVPGVRWDGEDEYLRKKVMATLTGEPMKAEV